MDLLDDAVTAARTVVTEKNPDLPAAELDTIAEQAGIGAVKYADLSTSRNKDYTITDLFAILTLVLAAVGPTKRWIEAPRNPAMPGGHPPVPYGY